MLGFVDVSSELFVELLKGLSDTDTPQMVTVAKGIPLDAKFQRFEVMQGGIVLRVWFTGARKPEEQFTPQLSVSR